MIQERRANLTLRMIWRRSCLKTTRSMVPLNSLVHVSMEAVCNQWRKVLKKQLKALALTGQKSCPSLRAKTPIRILPASSQSRMVRQPAKKGKFHLIKKGSCAIRTVAHLKDKILRNLARQVSLSRPQSCSQKLLRNVLHTTCSSSPTLGVAIRGQMIS